MQRQWWWMAAELPEDDVRYASCRGTQVRRGERGLRVWHGRATRPCSSAMRARHAAMLISKHRPLDRTSSGLRTLTSSCPATSTTSARSGTTAGPQCMHPSPACIQHGFATVVPAWHSAPLLVCTVTHPCYARVPPPVQHLPDAVGARRAHHRARPARQHGLDARGHGPRVQGVTEVGYGGTHPAHLPSQQLTLRWGLRGFLNQLPRLAGLLALLQLSRAFLRLVLTVTAGSGDLADRKTSNSAAPSCPRPSRLQRQAASHRLLRLLQRPLPHGAPRCLFRNLFRHLFRRLFRRLFRI